ncbi:TetR/AcrR family transcriptional regulator [Amnibacterium endophyticum]|uniref:TetR/AcrR family transcriptional regulator n=1 Tax=Amnibacterium endophyticum TaxID=2109337 RepID=A0ABW4LFV4_9MICO
MLAAATRLFAETGYSATTIRAVATEAGVDNALVIQFFGSKDGLFGSVLEHLHSALPDLGAAAAGSGEDRGRRLAEAYLSLWEAPETALPARALMRGAIGAPGATAIVQEFLETHVLPAAPQPQLAPVSAMLLGVALTRYVIRLGPLAEMPLAAVVELIAPALQAQVERR